MTSLAKFCGVDESYKYYEQTGYRDSGSLIRVFKKVTGMTPGQYKAAHSEE